MNNDEVEETSATTINSFYLQNNVSDTAILCHRSRIATTIDYISDINQWDIADGLKDSLIDHGIDLGMLLNTAPEMTSTILGIELYVAKLIHIAALKQYRSRTSHLYSTHKYEIQNQQ